MKSRSLLSSAVAILLFFSLTTYSQVQTARSNAVNANCGGYYEYLPKGYSTSQSYPLIVAVHGIGELGNGTTDLSRLLNCYMALPRRIANGGFPASVTVGTQSFSFIVISPQFKAWPSASDVNAVVDYAIQHYKVDQSRIYVTGLSMGGGAVWDFASAYPTKAAAVIPVCGARSATAGGAQAIANAKLPVWATHNSNDPTVSVNNTIGWVNLIKQDGGDAISSIFQATVHDAWTKTYDPAFTQNGVNIYQWMLQHKKGSTTTPNQAPVASAGSDQTITLPENSVALKGNGSDVDGVIKSYQWSQTSGPSQATIASAASASTTVSNLTQGTFVFTLKVTDDKGSSATDKLTITVNAQPNKLPVADAGQDQTITLPVNSITLNGSGKDSDGLIKAYEWDQTSGPSQANIVSQSSATTSVNNLVQGVYIFSLKVTDDGGATATSKVTITVNPAPPTPNQAPVASAGSDQTITLPENSVALKGNGSDVDGVIKSYQWSQTSGPSQATIASAASASTTVSNLTQGTFVFTLKVTDDKGSSATDKLTITVNAQPNKLPVADAGQDQTITLPVNSITLNGSGKDSDGLIKAYEWDQTSGPSQANIVSQSSATTSVNNLVQGVYIFSLKVTDDGGATATSKVTITVNPAPPTPNQAPVASAGSDQTITLPENSVALKGNGSDVDGVIKSYQWSQTSGPSQATIASAASASTTVSNLTQGTFVFTLKVTDDKGSSATDKLTITVNAQPNKLPVADAGQDQTITLPVNSITLNGSGKDSDGLIKAYEWDQTSGPSQANIVSQSSATTSVNNLVQGVYIFSLKVTDDGGATATSKVTITVNPAPPTPNQAPVASAGSDQTITLPENSVALKGNGSDVDGVIKSYQWSQTSGPSQATIASAASASTTVSNLTQGTFVFTLKVTDDKGSSATDKLTITVNAQPNKLPVADAGQDQTITLPVNSITLNGSGKDSDGLISSYEWIQLSGPSQANFMSPHSSTTAVEGLKQGVYVWRLAVTDNKGATASDDITVKVNLAPSVSVGTSRTTTLPHDSIKLSASAFDTDGSVILYQWNQIAGPAKPSFSSAYSPDVTVHNLIVGIYTFRVTVIDNNGATAWNDVTVTVMPNPAQPSIATLYPNPATNSLNIKIEAVTLQNNTSIRITNSAGKIVHSEEFTRTDFTSLKQIDISKLLPGVYFLTVNTDINTTRTLKFIKQ